MLSPATVLHPTSASVEVVAAVQILACPQASASTVKMVGSGHSFTGMEPPPSDAGHALRPAVSLTGLVGVDRDGDDRVTGAGRNAS